MLTIEELYEGEWYTERDSKENIYSILSGELYHFTPTENDSVEYKRVNGSYYGFKEMRFAPYNPPYTPSEEEIQLFKLLPDWAMWVAVDTDGYIACYSHKPRKTQCNYGPIEDSEDDALSAFSNIIKLTFDDGPLNIEKYRG